MMRFVKRAAALLLAIALGLFCCACSSLSVTTDPDDLYSLPRLPDEYTGLENSIAAILEDGAEYAAPTTGTNIQPVQLRDLDGDGQEEALAFFRKSTDEKPLKIYIFSAKDGVYEQTAVIEGSASSISSVEYSDLNQDGKMELLVGWKVSTDLQVLCVYELGPGQPQELLRAPCVKYAAADLNQDGKTELTILHTDTEGNGAADYYTWQGKNLVQQGSAKLSMTMAELSSIQSGTLQGGTPALFVIGVEDSSIEIVDILALRREELTNIVLSNVTGVSTEISRYLSLNPMDINADGVTEVPIPVSTSGNRAEADDCYRIDWHAYDAQGTGTTVESTYHDIQDGWYLVLPKEWLGKIAISRLQTGNDEITVTFSIKGDDGKDMDFLRIYAITGSGREYKVHGNRFVLRRQAETIFAAELLPGNTGWAYALTQDGLRANFNLITAEWLP